MMGYKSGKLLDLIERRLSPGRMISTIVVLHLLEIELRWSFVTDFDLRVLATQNCHEMLRNIFIYTN